MWKKYERRISVYVTSGKVSAAVLSKSGKIYIDKVLCILPDGSNGTPCGACRELMVQILAGKYKDIEIMLDYSTGRTVKLGEITPEWWIQ